jgi:hypothetical protein
MIGVQPHFGPADPGGVALFAGIIRALLPVMEQTGVATAGQVQPESLEKRLAEEFAAAGAVMAYPTLLSAWGVA